MIARRELQLLLTCEHASNAVPLSQRRLFAGHASVLNTHRAYDIGAKSVARGLAKALAAPLHVGAITRLLVDLNRSIGHRDLHSTFAGELSAEARAQLVARWHAPFRAACMQELHRLAGRGPVLHLSVHSFTPLLAGAVRNCAIGLLYDPGRTRERELADALAAELSAVAPELRVRRNYPYRGSADGHTTSLRRGFSERQYMGIEIELNQRLLVQAAQRRRVLAVLTRAVRNVVATPRRRVVS